METREPARNLTRSDRARVASRVGWQPDESIDPSATFVDTTSLVALLETSPKEHDEHHWVYRPQERVRILQTLMLADGAPWVGRFAFLLTLAVLIATLGLANDQPAAVIAAMVVAPLMTPVLGIACSMTLGLVRQTLRLVTVVATASLFAVAFGWIISASLVVHQLTGEELSRTTPRLRDFMIALAAGAAGMYSVVRKDLSGVVPGVAIAVALVPPLATIGIVLELQEWTLARGAALLYAMNVMAIVVAAIVVLLITDFMQSPPWRDPKVLLSGVALAVLSLGVFLPIWGNSRRLDREADFAQHTDAAVESWDVAHPAHHVVVRNVDPGSVRLLITGPTEPPALEDLRRDLRTDAYPQPVIEVEWAPSFILDVGD